MTQQFIIPFPWRSKLWIAALLWSSFFQTYAQENLVPKVWTLPKAIAYGMENNRQIRNADLEVQKAFKEQWKTIATGLPQISASSDYTNFLRLPVSLIPAEIFGGTPGTFTEVQFGTEQNLVGSLRWDQLIFDGSYIVGLQASKVYLQISENIFEKTQLEIKKGIVEAYTAVLFADENVEVTLQNKSALEESLSELHALYRNGFEEEESVEQMRLTLAGIESQLRYARRMQKVTRGYLALFLGLDPDQPLSLQEELEDLLLSANGSQFQTAEADLNNNADIKIAQNDLASQELLLKLEKSRALPRLSAFLSGTYTGNSDRFTFLNSDQKWFGSSLFGLSLKIPLFSSLGRSASTQKAKLSVIKAENTLTETEDRIRLEIEQSKSALELALENYSTAKESLSLAERIEQKNRTKFFEGMASAFELRQAQLQLYSSQSQLLRSVQDVINSATTLETLLNSPQPENLNQ
ncbi:MAG: TolC family protein [Flavobacteriaceae bacterium]